ncbi:MAG TPA: hypothetical protein VGQ81_10590 [Acidobacteriota bacterium]|jgi:ribosomal protein L24E|nr:hypothetical protein [Acidobacteriota bacterium]
MKQVIEFQEQQERLGEKPQEHRCCICNQSIRPGNSMMEVRRTGKEGTKENWYYCRRCWNEMLAMRARDTLFGGSQVQSTLNARCWYDGKEIEAEEKKQSGRHAA